MDKNKYKNEFAKAGEGAIDDLLPVIKKNISAIFNIFQEFINEALTEFVNKKVKKQTSSKKKRKVENEG